MTDRSAFTPEEWTLLRVTPSLVGVGVIAADGTGLFAAILEALAGARGMTQSLGANRDLELFAALQADASRPDLPDAESLLGQGSNEAKLESFRTAALEHVRAAVELLARKATPAETEAYRNLLLRVAEQAANAAKEGGFFGFGGERVSAKERAFIELVRDAAWQR